MCAFTFSRALTFEQQVLALLLTYIGWLIAPGPDVSTRNARVMAVKKYLTAAGIDSSRVLTQVGSIAGDRVSAAVLHQLGTGPRLTTG